jgi:hypothetical protein
VRRLVYSQRQRSDEQWLRTAVPNADRELAAVPVRKLILRNLAERGQRFIWGRLEVRKLSPVHVLLSASSVQDSLEASGFEIRSQIIWAKERFALSRGNYHWQHEPCWYAVRGTAQWTGDRKQSTLWNINAREGQGLGHGTQKPVACMQRPIENNSSPGQAVYDPFSGSGTTIIAAEMTGRHCYGMEIDPVYVDVAVERWERFTGAEAVLEGTGQPASWGWCL